MNRPGCSARTLAAILAAMPPGSALRPREIHARQSEYSLITVRHALRELVAAGRIEAIGPDMNRRYVRREAA